jgi:hypothetical protein
MKLLAIFLLVAATATCHAQRHTESSNVKAAYTFHILVGAEVEAKRLQAEIEKAKPEERLAKFKEVARRSSTDPSSRTAGGDLDWVFEGEMVRSFEDTIFASTPNKLIPPFRSDFGWHLAYVTEFRELPVAGICRPALTEAHRRAEGQWKAGLGLAMEPLNPVNISDQVRAVIGIDWVGPMKDREGNFVFIRSREGYDDDLRNVSQHIEFPEGVLAVTARPKGCAYSARIDWSIHCDDRRIAFLSSTYFEGRGAVGRRLAGIFVGEPRAEFKPILQGSLTEQLHHLACGE